ncbi:unnamed protein product [Protopolystoma xenopodis]|uniref:Uncharacterized protein n=1 Tax=Protopolystoma xenopodis TaxID=117903 RepID=A0A3S5CIF6_9PLAT|nr:unnamed protein product [Protopolystoma xenopodis]
MVVGWRNYGQLTSIVKTLPFSDSFPVPPHLTIDEQPAGVQAWLPIVGLDDFQAQHTCTCAWSENTTLMAQSLGKRSGGPAFSI